MPAPRLGVGGGEQQLGVVGAQLERLGQEARGLVDGADGAGVLGRAGELRRRPGRRGRPGAGGGPPRRRGGAGPGSARSISTAAIASCRRARCGLGQVGVDGLAQERVAVAEAAVAGDEQAGLDGAAGGARGVVEGEADELAGVEVAAGHRGQLGDAAGVVGQRCHGGAHRAAQARGRLALAAPRARAACSTASSALPSAPSTTCAHVGIVDRADWRGRGSRRQGPRAARARARRPAHRGRAAPARARPRPARRGSSRRVSTTSTGRRGTRRAT